MNPRLPAHHLSGRWLELENGPLDFSAPRDVDDEVEPGSAISPRRSVATGMLSRRASSRPGAHG